ncbi:trp RNA-binding attenuation protein MtrB [Hydrogenibacillus sp. N12]|uniref:trp RNA-binding attenuation protein MtrB n=1 Tax=Hydrogenibacillus sp. N12 TaxID=2866627 RepID=UPI0019DD1B70|nr:trp RNA-binding attenuation protein MtrB [Hydrogenibacillus sp. N12]MBE3562771.1 trp RNA-binding attenuation protein MtrB [Hydrogenibacillus schlegelii]QZA32345.1 trp RNA-binding attenuation protein MtrB [Hydrogenibacillus sp. N12]
MGEGGRAADWTSREYVVIKAKENGVHVIGLTRGDVTRFHHTEKLDKNEVMIAQFTEHTSAIKVRGRAVIYTAVGTIHTDRDD